jgi:hypothetical protein
MASYGNDYFTDGLNQDSDFSQDAADFLEDKNL